MENHHISVGKKHYFDWAIFYDAMENSHQYQRERLPRAHPCFIHKSNKHIPYINQLRGISCRGNLFYVKIAIENHHRNSGFSH